MIPLHYISKLEPLTSVVLRIGGTAMNASASASEPYLLAQIIPERNSNENISASSNKSQPQENIPSSDKPGHDYKTLELRDQAVQINGNCGLESGGVSTRHSYNHASAKDQSRQFNGNSTERGLQVFLESSGPEISAEAKNP